MKYRIIRQGYIDSGARKGQYRHGPNGAITVESMYGPTIAKPRIEAKAITFGRLRQTFPRIPKSQSAILARLFLYDFAPDAAIGTATRLRSALMFVFPGYKAIQGANWVRLHCRGTFHKI